MYRCPLPGPGEIGWEPQVAEPSSEFNQEQRDLNE